jgi:hypothetical protein
MASRYRGIIGSRNWAVILGRFDVMYATNTLARFSMAPRLGHLEAAKRILPEEILRPSDTSESQPDQHEIRRRVIQRIYNLEGILSKSIRKTSSQHVKTYCGQKSASYSSSG